MIGKVKLQPKTKSEVTKLDILKIAEIIKIIELKEIKFKNKLKQKRGNVISRFARRSLFVLSLLGTPNYYKGIDKPTFLQWLYKWRLNLKTAIEVDKILHS